MITKIKASCCSYFEVKEKLQPLQRGSKHPGENARTIRFCVPEAQLSHKAGL